MANLISHNVAIAFDGSDFVTLLDRISTISTNNIPIPGSKYGCLLNNRSILLCDFWIHRVTDSRTIIDIHKSMIDVFIQRINLYKMRMNFSQDTSIFYVLYGDHDIKDQNIIHRTYDQRIIGNKIMRFISHDNHYKESKDEYHDMLIQNCILEGHTLLKFHSRPFILEYHFHKFGAIDLGKGCYPGQELITRTLSVGSINKSIYKILAQNKVLQNGKENISLDLSLLDNDEIIGKIISFTNNKDIAVALLRSGKISDHNQLKSSDKKTLWRICK